MILLLRKYWAVGVIVLAWMVFAYPYFLQNKIVYPAAFQNTFFSPWSDYPELSMPVKNNALSDVVTQIYPWKKFTIEELKKGSIPWWNPYSFSGNPHAANFQSAVFTPFNLIYFVLPFIDAWSLIILIQPLLAGFFMYLFLKSLKISTSGAVIGSGGFMFCGFLVVWMPYGTLSMAILFLPLALYAVEKYLSGSKYVFLILLTFTIFMSFVSGHVQTSFYFLATVIAYVIYRVIILKEKKYHNMLLLSIIAGIFISLIQIYPSLEIYLSSARVQEGYSGGAIPFQYLITVIAPDFYGNPVTRNEWVGHYAEWAGFTGVVAVFLAIISVYSKNKRIFNFFILLGAAALLLGIDSPLQYFYGNSGIPILSNSIPSRVIVVFSFSIAVLAALGLDTIKELLKNKNYKAILVPNVIYIVFFGVIWGMLFFGAMPEDKSITAMRNFVLPSGLIAIMTGLIALSVRIRNSKFIGFLIATLIFLNFAGGVYFAIKWVPFDPRDILSPNLPVIAAMQNNLRGGRVFGKIGSYIDSNYKLPSIEGYDPLYNRRYGEFIESAKTGSLSPAIKSLAILDKNAKYADRVLDLLGVTVIYHVIGDTNKQWAYPVWEERFFDKYKIVYSDDKFQVYNNKAALPRAKLFFDYEVIQDSKGIIKRFYDDKFDFRNKLILEEEPKIINSIKDKVSSIKGSARSSVVIDSYTGNRVVISVETEKAGLLFLSDSFYPKWGAKVNGSDAKIYRANYTFRAVKVNPGKSLVEFYFDPYKII